MEFRQVDTGAVTLRCAVEGSGPLAIMVHGFPESWYSWRHQIGPVAGAGFTACAIDVRGYGGSDKPHPVEAYTLEAIAGDLIGLADALSPDEPVVLIGHDWGAPIVWNTAFTNPERVRAVAGLSVPFAGAPLRPFTEVFREAFTSKGRFFYQEYFQEPGVAEAEAEADPRHFVEKMMYSISGDVPPGNYWDKPAGATFLQDLPEPQPVPWLTAQDLDYYEGEFKASGFRGPLNRYRNHTRDFDYMSTVSDRVIHQPSLFIVGEQDLVLKMFGGSAEAAFERMAANTSDHRGSHMIPRIGHWTQQEAPKETTGLIIDWLATL